MWEIDLEVEVFMQEVYWEELSISTPVEQRRQSTAQLLSLCGGEKLGWNMVKTKSSANPTESSDIGP